MTSIDAASNEFPLINLSQRAARLCDRILQCMQLRCPEALDCAWSIGGRPNHPYGTEAWFIESNLKFHYSQEHSIRVFDVSEAWSTPWLVFSYRIDLTTSWHANGMLEEVEAVVNRILVLDRLAEL